MKGTAWRDKGSSEGLIGRIMLLENINAISYSG